MNVRRSVLALTAVLSLVACQDKKAAPAGAGSATPTTAASLKPQATPIKAGQPFTVAFTGPNGPSDYVDIVAPATSPSATKWAT